MIETQTIKAQYEPSSATTSFPFNIPYFDNSDINVEVVNGETLTTLVLDAVSDGFTVSATNGNSNNGATITTTESYTDGDAITIYREVPKTQLADFQRGGDLPPEVLNSALDRGVAISQELSDAGTRHLVCPVTDPEGLSYELPIVELRKNKVAGFDNDGSAIAVDVGGEGGLVGVDTSKGLEVNSGIVAGKVDNDTLSFNGAGQSYIPDNAIVTAKIENGAIVTAKIENGAIVTAKIVANAVTLPKIQTIGIYTVIGNMDLFQTTPSEVTVYDEDTLVSDSHIALATQGSIKAYIDGYKTHMSYLYWAETQFFDTPPLIPKDGTIPQADEGTKVMWNTFIPNRADSLIKIEVIVTFASEGGYPVVALFKEGTSDALATVFEQTSSDSVSNLTLTWVEVAGSTDARTYNVNIGSSTSLGDITFNGDANDQDYYGGTTTSSITVTEIKI